MSRLIRSAASIAAIALILTACSTTGSSPSASSAQSSAPSSAPSSAAASSEPSAGASAGESSEPTPGSGGASFDPSTVEPDSLLGQIMESGVVRISTDPNYAPYSFLDTATGEYVGFDNGTAEEVVERMSEKLGQDLEIQWETPGWDLITAGNWGGRWDMSIGSMSITEARARVVDFADPYYFDGGGIAVPANSAITSVEELNDKTFCVGTATVYEQWLQGTLEIPAENQSTPPANATITALPTDNECIQAVAAGRTEFDAIVANINALTTAEEAGQPIRVITEEPVLLVEVAFALDKSGPDTASMLELLNIIVAEMHEDGTLSALSMEHLDQDVTQRPE